MNSFTDKSVRLSLGEDAILIKVKSNLENKVLLRVFFGTLLTSLMKDEYEGIKLEKAFKIKENGSYLELHPKDGELYEIIGKK